MWVNEYLQYIRYEKNYSAHTVVAYGNDLAVFLAFLAKHYEVTQPHDISAEMIRSWMMEQLEQGLTPRTVNRKLSCLKSYWRYLTRKGFVTINPTKGVPSPKTNKPLPVFLKEEEVNNALALEDKKDCPFETLRDRLITDVFYQTGMRRSELIGLTDPDVDTATKMIKVTGKRDKQRLIPFGDRLADAIVDYRNLRQKTVSGESVRFFVRVNGVPLYPQLVYRIIHNKLIQVATLSKNSPHVLRHTFATTLLNEGAELNAVKELLGHSSLSATEVYTHTTFEELKKVYKQAHPRA